MSMKSYKARGIVLHTLKYGDSGMVVYLLTDSGGRQSYMVQGVRSARGHGSKLALFQPMFAVEFEGLESSRMQMHRFREVRAGFALQSLPFDVRKSTMALFMAEVLYRLVRESEPNRPLFDFVWGSAEALDAMDDGVSNFHLWFLLRLSGFLGFLPNTEQYAEGAFFDLLDGVFVTRAPAHPHFLLPDEASAFAWLMRMNTHNMSLFRFSRDERRAVLQHIIDYYRLHQPDLPEIRSLEVMQQLFD